MFKIYFIILASHMLTFIVGCLFTIIIEGFYKDK